MDPGDEEHLVIHRESEHDREQEDRDKGVDRPTGDAQQGSEPAPLEDRNDDAQRCTDRKQVHRGGLNGDHQGSEDDHEQEAASTTTMPMNSGSFEERTLAKSTCDAVDPPTSTLV